MDICFTRDDIYLRLMENQRVKVVRSLYSVLSPIPENFSSVQDMRAISMFPNYTGELASLSNLHRDLEEAEKSIQKMPVKKRKGVLQFFQF
jgi:hypothetical protein